MVMNMEMLKCDRCGKIVATCEPIGQGPLFGLSKAPVRICFDWKGPVAGVNSVDLCDECAGDLEQFLKACPYRELGGEGK